MKNMLNNNIKLEGPPNQKYEKFFKKFEEISVLDPSSWNATHLLGYFCKKYKEQYQIDYKFKFNSPTPSKCFEIFQIKKLAMNLTSDPVLLKEYIDWVYTNKVIKAKRRLTSISFMTNEGVMNEYKINVLLSNDHKSSIDRTTLLPDKYKNIFESIGFAISTYGELAFIYQMNDEKVIKAISQIELMGFDKSNLEKIV